MTKNQKFPKVNVSSKFDVETRIGMKIIANEIDVSVSKLVHDVCKTFLHRRKNNEWDIEELKAELEDARAEVLELRYISKSLQKKNEKLERDLKFSQISVDAYTGALKEGSKQTEKYERESESQKNTIGKLYKALEQEKAKNQKLENDLLDLEERLESKLHRRLQNAHLNILDRDAIQALKQLQDIFQERDIEIINASLKVAAQNSKVKNSFFSLNDLFTELKDINDLLTPKTV